MIKVGTLTLEASDPATTDTVKAKHQMGIGGGSSVVLIRGKNKLILVDTGFEFEGNLSEDNKDYNKKVLINALKERGLSPDDIDILFITHWHRDHFGSMDLFNKARHLASKTLVEKFGPPDFEPVENLALIDESVVAVYTPGHTLEHCSLLVEDTFKIAVAGDAIVTRGYFEKGKIWNYNPNFFDEEAAMLSMKLLGEASQVIIPGHGAPFMTFRPKWMDELKIKK